jgi:hypothetical protein
MSLLWIVAAGVGLVAALLLFLWLLWWWLPKWQANRLRFQIRDAKARAGVEDNYRKAQLIAGAAVLGGAWFAYSGTQQTIEASREATRQTVDASRKQAADAYQASHDQLISQQVSKGFELLGQMGKDKIFVRLDGIYALEGVMNDATSKQYHQPVLEALCAFVRKSTKDVKGQEPPATDIRAKPPATDIQAALTVIGRRGPGEGRVDLTGAYIPKADLFHANLSGAFLSEANLSGAFLSDANLSDAHLYRANLSGAILWDTNLSGTGLIEANLPFAKLSGADLSGADLSGAVLYRANVSGAQLRGDTNLSGTNLSSTNVSRDQLDKACGDGLTELPPTPSLTIKPCPKSK